MVGLPSDPDALLRLGHDLQRKVALETALRLIKQRAVAENLMEVITCGAVPPYGEILGGKLVAMLLTSPRVVADFRARYEGRVSLIASGMKGAPVRRRPRLGVLTTSSLYSVGSSQYNRLRVPGVLGGSGTVAYQQIGTSSSYGTVHFSPGTAEALSRLADSRRTIGVGSTICSGRG